MTAGVEFESAVLDEHLRKALSDRPIAHLCLNGVGNVQFFAHFDSRIASR